VITMQLYIQDPTDQKAPFLQERILQVCEGATRGAGAFAFVTSEGVDLLLKDKVFKKFATRGSFDLIVGVDEVTDVRALMALQETSRELPGLTVNVFYHDLPQAVFHPKFCWFRHRTKGFLIASSGNLTARGLRGNWEAFAVGELEVGAADALEAQWTRWVELHAARLRPPDDENVLARAALNIRRRRPGGRAPTPEEEEREAPEELPTGLTQLRRVLVAEIPRASGRWNQANFDLNSFRNFFGAEPGVVQRVVLQHVDAAGVLGSLETRPSVSVKSRNFRFELVAAAGLTYPRAGRPIAVFIEIAPRTFRYRLLMPRDPQHRIMDAFLDTIWTGPSDRMRRVITTTDVVQQAWPDSPLWRMPLEVDE
jgi:hypothetical protein